MDEKKHGDLHAKVDMNTVSALAVTVTSLGVTSVSYFGQHGLSDRSPRRLRHQSEPGGLLSCS